MVAYPIRVPRGTKAAMDAAAGASSLLEGEIRYLTDDKKFVGATGTGAYAPLGGGGEVETPGSASFTLEPGHNGKTLYAYLHSDATIPNNSNVELPIGFAVEIVAGGTWLSIKAQAGVSFNSASMLAVAPRTSARLKKLTANAWQLENGTTLVEPTVATSGSAQGTSSNPNVAVPYVLEAGDLWIIAVETAAYSVTTPTGFTAVPSGAQSTGTAGGTSSTALYLFYRVANGSETSVSLTQAGTDHYVSLSVVVKGVDPVNPIDSSSGSVAAASTSVSLPSVTTTRNNALILSFLAGATDTGSSQFTLGTNTALKRLKEEADTWTSSGNGGGLVLVSGIKSGPGATGATSGTLAASSVQAFCTIAINAK